MHANVGDQLVMTADARGVERDGLILEVRGADGEPPYLVRWSDDGHLALVYPAADAYVQTHMSSQGTTTTPG